MIFIPQWWGIVSAGKHFIFRQFPCFLTNLLLFLDVPHLVSPDRILSPSHSAFFYCRPHLFPYSFFLLYEPILCSSHHTDLPISNREDHTCVYDPSRYEYMYLPFRWLSGRANEWQGYCGVSTAASIASAFTTCMILLSLDVNITVADRDTGSPFISSEALRIRTQIGKPAAEFYCSLIRGTLLHSIFVGRHSRIYYPVPHSAMAASAWPV